MYWRMYSLNVMLLLSTIPTVWWWCAVDVMLLCPKIGLRVSASGQRRLALEHLGCGYSNPAHTHATINKQMFVLHNTSRCNSCLTAGPKH